MYASFSRHNVCCTHVFKGVCDPRVYIHRKKYIYILYVRYTAAVARDSAFSAQLCSVALQSSSNTTWHADATVLTQTAKWTGPIQVCESMARYYLPWDDLRGLHLQSMKCQEVIRRVNSKKKIYIYPLLVLVVVVVIIFVVVILLFLLDRFCFSSSSYSVRFKI